MFKYLREDINTVFERDPAARSRFEVYTCYPGIHALMLHRIAHGLWEANLTLLARWVSHWSRFWTGIEIHPAAQIGRRVFIAHGMGTVIGETAEIGEGCTLCHGVTLGDLSWSKGKRHPTLGRNVVVGPGATLLGPIVIGDGANIGSNAVVVDDVAPGASVVGVAARMLAAYSEENGAALRPQLADEMVAPVRAAPVSHEVERIEPAYVEPQEVVDARIEEVLQQLDELEEKLTVPTRKAAANEPAASQPKLVQR